jgi:Zn-dependent protease with chaperone function
VNWLPKLLEDGFIAGVDEAILEETKTTRFPSSSSYHALVEEVGNRITKENNLRRLTYHVCNSKEVNAMVTPGGHVYVYTGMLGVLETPDDLAIVLGHEMSHKIASTHPYFIFFSISMFPFFSCFLILFLFLEHSIDDLLVNLAINLVRLLLDYESNLLLSFSQLALTLPYSRNHEREADHMGLVLAARAGYNPSRAALLWARMAHVHENKDAGGVEVKEQDGEYVVEDPTVNLDKYYSTHPTDSERVHNFRHDGPYDHPPFFFSLPCDDFSNDFFS